VSFARQRSLISRFLVTKKDLSFIVTRKIHCVTSFKDFFKPNANEFDQMVDRLIDLFTKSCPKYA